MSRLPTQCPAGWGGRTGRVCELQYLKACTKKPFIRSLVNFVKSSRPDLLSKETGYMGVVIDTFTDLVEVTSGAAVFGLGGCVRKIKYADCALASTVLSSRQPIGFMNAFKMLATKLYAGCGNPALRLAIQPLMADLDQYIRRPPQKNTAGISRSPFGARALFEEEFHESEINDYENFAVTTPDTISHMTLVSKPTKDPLLKKKKKDKKVIKKKSKKSVKKVKEPGFAMNVSKDAPMKAPLMTRSLGLSGMSPPTKRESRKQMKDFLENNK